MKKCEEQMVLPLVQIPESANYSLPDEALLAFYHDLDERVFWISDEISAYTLNLAHYILKWNREDKEIPIGERKPIKLLIHSPGGSLDVLGVLYDLIRLPATPIIGINMGQAYSASAMILLACHKRYGLKIQQFSSIKVAVRAPEGHLRSSNLSSMSTSAKSSNFQRLL